MLLPRFPIWSIVVAFHKPSLAGSSMASRPDVLYSYLVRFTVERISRFAASSLHPHCPSDGKCQIVFSENTALPYEAIKSYLRKLRDEHPTDIEWDFIDFESSEPVAFRPETACHLADIVASASFPAFDGSSAGTS
jgi:hypothetical protein